MNRRSLFKALGSLVGGAILAPLAKLLPADQGVSLKVIRSYDPVRDSLATRIDLQLSIDEFAERYVSPAIKAYVDVGEVVVEGIKPEEWYIS